MDDSTCRPSFWELVWRDSLLGQWVLQWATRVRAWLAPAAKSSVTAQRSGELAAMTAFSLLLASPFVSAGANALLVLLAFSAALSHRCFRPRHRLPPAELMAPIACYMAVGLVATAFSAFPILAFKGYAKMFVGFLAYLAFSIALADRRYARGALWALAATATTVATYGIYQYIIKVPPLATWEDVKVLDKVTRVYSTLRNPNLLGGYLILTAFLTWILFWWEQRPWRWLAWPATAAQFACLVYTYSRGAYVGALAGAACLLAGLVGLYRQELQASPWLRKALVAVLILGLAGAVVAVRGSPALKNRLFSILEGRSDSSNNFRMNVWRADRHIIRDNWAIGIGPGNDVFRKVYPLYMVSGYEALAAYNIFLEVWTEMGLAGLLAYLWIWWSHLRACLGCAAARPDRVLLLGCAGALVGTALFGLVDTVLFRPQVTVLFWLALALIGMASRRPLHDNAGSQLPS